MMKKVSNVLSVSSGWIALLNIIVAIFMFYASFYWVDDNIPFLTFSPILDKFLLFIFISNILIIISRVISVNKKGAN